MEEIWKPVVGYEGLYEVSNLGQVKSIQFDKERLLKPTVTNKGYYLVALYKDKIKTFKTVHRLVIRTFIGEPKNNQECDHIDRNSLNNQVSNLRWVDRSKNLSNRKGWAKDSKYIGSYKGIRVNKNGSVTNYIYSQITVNKKTYKLGVFNTEEEAHEAYKQAFLKYRGYEWI